MEYPERIQRSIDYIEAHLSEELAFEDIAGEAFVSLPHLYRMFPAMTGNTVGQYIRKRRLTCSASELINTGKRIIDIAMDYRFESQESYIRAFKALFGVTPGAYRREKGAIALFNRIHISKMQKKGELLMQPEILTKKFVLIGLETDMDLRVDFTEKMERLRRSLKQRLNEIPGRIAPERLTGIWQPFDDKDEMSPMRLYFAGVEVASAASVPDGLVLKALPDSMYARFREKTRGTMTRYAYTEWLPASGYILNEDAMCDLEIFDDLEHYQDGDPCDILLPIRAAHL